MKILISLMLLWSAITFAQDKKTFEFTVEGMTCNNCAKGLTETLQKNEGRGICLGGLRHQNC